jgi:hypothetical protein
MSMAHGDSSVIEMEHRGSTAVLRHFVMRKLGPEEIQEHFDGDRCLLLSEKFSAATGGKIVNGR